MIFVIFLFRDIGVSGHPPRRGCRVEAGTLGRCDSSSGRAPCRFGLLGGFTIGVLIITYTIVGIPFYYCNYI